jgi:uncharacterized protein (TIGR03083 family)
MRYEKLVSTTPAELWRRIDLAHDRFAQLMAEVPDGLALPSSTWTARDLAGHLLTVARRYTRPGVRTSQGLADSPRSVDDLNASELAELDGTPKGDLLAALAEQLEAVRAAHPASDDCDLHDQFPFHGGVIVDRAAALSNLLGEFLVHGRDLATAARRPWPIEPLDARLILNGVMQIVPAYANRKATGELHLQLRVPGARRWALCFAEGRVTSRPAQDSDRPDVVLRAPADVLMLALYSRLTPAEGTRRGMVPIGGRRPWRIVRLPGLLEAP